MWAGLTASGARGEMYTYFLGYNKPHIKPLFCADIKKEANKQAETHRLSLEEIKETAATMMGEKCERRFIPGPRAPKLTRRLIYLTKCPAPARAALERPGSRRNTMCCSFFPRFLTVSTKKNIVKQKTRQVERKKKNKHVQSQKVIRSLGISGREWHHRFSRAEFDKVTS